MHPLCGHLRATNPTVTATLRLGTMLEAAAGDIDTIFVRRQSQTQLGPRGPGREISIREDDNGVKTDRKSFRHDRN